MLSRLKSFLFLNVSPLVKLGQKKILEFDDLLPSPKELALDKNLEVAPLDLSSEKKFLLALLKEQRGLVIRAWSFYLLAVITSLSSPLLINLFITRLTEPGLHYANHSYQLLYIVLGIVLNGIFIGIGYQHNFYSTLLAQFNIVSRLNRLIFEKALKLTQRACQKVNIGDVVNHMSSDSEAIANIPMALGDFGWASLLFIGALSMLFYFLGWTALVAVVVFITLIPLTKKIGKKVIKLEDEMMQKRDRRVTLMSQILQSMRLVKYFVWEKEVENQVASVRSEEVNARKSLAKTEMLSGLLFAAISSMTLFISLTIHILRGEVLSPALVLTCVSLFGLLQEPVGHLANVFSRLFNSWVSARRLISFLNAETVPQRLSGGPSGDSIIHFDHLTYTNDEGSFSLKDINCKISKGASVAIVGAVGSGKSTLLQLILGEINPLEGNVFVNTDKLGYVSQESYILNATILENLKMGRLDLSSVQIEEALYYTNLKHDLANLPGGLLTEIGEKGVNLSGGQKQRLSLARCFLQEPDIVLLDDPLSAVDVHTEKFLVENLLLHAWKDKTRIIVTHRLEALDKFDRILFLENGKIIADGKLEQLLLTSPEFKFFFSHHLDIQGAEKNSSHIESPSSLDNSNSRLIKDEDREQGVVKGSLYWDYVKALGGETSSQKWIIALLLLGALMVSIFPLVSQWWLSWFPVHTESVTPIQGVLIYGLIVLLNIGTQVGSQIFWLQRGINAGIELHNNMLKNLLRAPVRFFDSTPVGRLLQRFSRDLEAVDIQLQWSFEASVQCLFQILVALFLIIVSVPFVLAVIIPVGWYYWNFQLAYRASAREVKRMDSIMRSPRYAHFKETLSGLPIIRAYKKESWFRLQFFDHLEKSLRASVNSILLNRWFSLRIPFIGSLISGITALCLIYSVQQKLLTPSVAGLVLIYSMSFWAALNWGIRLLAELESRMTSIERIRFMTKVSSEIDVFSEPQTPVHENWPHAGHIKFVEARARYDESLPEVVKGLSVEIPSQSQVGIIGRTGAGKSTLFQMIYRFINLHSGSILIDGVNIASIDLETLRSRLAIIPQDPTLFLGTIRSNLDPYSKKTDQEIWKVLEDTELIDLVKGFKLGLHTVITDSGANLSQGQRQLFCLARALLLDAKIIMLDEATASVDVVSDAKIQRVLRKELKGKTVLIIAHRLGTVADLDYLMVINDGQLESFRKPTDEHLIPSEFGLLPN